MKVCLIASSSLRMSPYVRKYANLLDEMNIEYDIFSKEHIREYGKTENSEKIFFYRDAAGPLAKLLRFLDYGRFIKKKIKAGNYTKAVFFTGVNAAFAYLCFGRYMRKKLPYILDIRDYDESFKHGVISRYLRGAVRHADAVVLSSARFKKWIPNSETVYVMHNLPNNVAKTEHSTVFQKDIVRIAYLGGISYYRQNTQIADQLANKNGYMLTFRGSYPSEYHIADYCREHDIKNTEFFGRYNDKDKKMLYRDVDIINAVYGNDSLIVTTALPNKLYDCIFYKIPIMVSCGTYLSQIVEEYGLGFSVDTEKAGLDDKIAAYIQGFDRQKFEEGCEKFLEVAQLEQTATELKIKEFFAEEVKKA